MSRHTDTSQTERTIDLTIDINFAEKRGDALLEIASTCFQWPATQEVLTTINATNKDNKEIIAYAFLLYIYTLLKSLSLEESLTKKLTNTDHNKNCDLAIAVEKNLTSIALCSEWLKLLYEESYFPQEMGQEKGDGSSSYNHQAKVYALELMTTLDKSKKDSKTSSFVKDSKKLSGSFSEAQTRINELKKVTDFEQYFISYQSFIDHTKTDADPTHNPKKAVGSCLSPGRRCDKE